MSYQHMFRFPDPVRAGQDALRNYELSYRQQPPDLLLINVGLHIAHDPAEFNTTLAGLFNLAEIVAERHKTKLLWKTTTHGMDAWPLRAKELDMLAAHSFPALDVNKMVASAAEQLLNFTWDGTHFLPVVYEQFNDVLLNHMCE